MKKLKKRLIAVSLVCLTLFFAGCSQQIDISADSTIVPVEQTLENAMISAENYLHLQKREINNDLDSSATLNTDNTYLFIDKETLANEPDRYQFMRDENMLQIMRMGYDGSYTTADIYIYETDEATKKAAYDAFRTDMDFYMLYSDSQMGVCLLTGYDENYRQFSFEGYYGEDCYIMGLFTWPSDKKEKALAASELKELNNFFASLGLESPLDKAWEKDDSAGASKIRIIDSFAEKIWAY